MLKDDQIKLLMVLHDLEKVLRDIYKEFSRLFPEHNVLWQQLIQEEDGHASAVRNLYKLTYEGKAVFAEGNLSTVAAESILDYLKEVLRKAEAGKFTAKQALSTSCDLEQSMIEKNIFKHFKVLPEYVNIIRTLHEGTQKHAQMVKNEMNKLG